MENAVLRSVRIAAQKAQYDTYCKRILGNKIILAWILKYTVEEFKEFTVEEITEKYIEGAPEIGMIPVLPGELHAGTAESITGLDTEDAVPNEGKVTYDLRFRAYAPAAVEPALMMINVEAQKKYNPGYPIVTRGVFYGARMLSSQYEREFTAPDYADIKKVYTIWICMSVPQMTGDGIVSYSLKKQDIYGRIPEEKKHYDLLHIVMICLNQKKEDGDNQLINLFKVLFSDTKTAAEKLRILSEQYGICMNQQEEKELGQMCNLSDLIEEKGIEKGEKRKLVKMVCKKLQKGKTPEIIAEELEEAPGVVEQICGAAQNAFPDYDCDKILGMLQL